MNYARKVVDDMEALLLLLRPHCVEVSTFDELIALAQEDNNWHKAYGLFQKIRKKTLQIERKLQTKAQAQYLFEEICAKTLYNLSGSQAPFDHDSAYWLLPSALIFARQAGVPEQDVISCVSKNQHPLAQ